MKNMEETNHEKSSRIAFIRRLAPFGRCLFRLPQWGKLRRCGQFFNHRGIRRRRAGGDFSHGWPAASDHNQQPPEDGATALVATGKAQFGVDFQDYLAPAYVSDLPVTAVAALIQHNTSGIISLKEKGIQSPKDLEGKTYATWDLPVEQATMQNVVENDGGDWSKVNLASVTVTDVISALQTNIDAVWIYYAWDGIATQVKGLDTNYFYFKDINPVFDYYTPVLVANNDYLEQNPETAKAFLAAVAKGYEYAIENPEEAAEILCEADPTLDSEIVLSSQQWLADQYKAEVDRWGYIDPSRWDAFYQWLWENQLIEEEIPAGFGFSNDYLPE